jgi:hypothetical protein
MNTQCLSGNAFLNAAEPLRRLGTFHNSHQFFNLWLAATSGWERNIGFPFMLEAVKGRHGKM